MSSRSSKSQVVVLRGGETLARHALDRSPIRIGRHADCDIVLDDPSVGETHALLVEGDAGWRLRSLDPAGPLSLDGLPTELHTPADGDEVAIGPFVLRFELGGQADVDTGSAPVLDDRTRVLVGDNVLEVPDIEPEGPPVTIPGYVVDVELGRGGMGRVYRAMQQSTHRTVALKVMLEGPGTSDKAKRRFEREVRIVASLRHPNIAQIYDSGVHQGRSWFAMEYVDGRPMDVGSAVSKLGLREKLELMHKVCQAVGHAHQRGIIHRDLKPSNILVGDDGEPHVLDFGLAKAQEADAEQSMMLSMSGELMGTPAYMSPEQTVSDASKIDTRTDVYSLGVILFQLVTGEFPYNVRGRLDEVIREIATTDPTRPSTIRKEIDAETEAIILKAIAKRPEERYASAGEMAEDLRRMLAGEPISARLEDRSYVLSKAVRKNRRWLIGAAALLAVVVATALVTKQVLTSSRPGDSASASTQPASGTIEPAKVAVSTPKSMQAADKEESPSTPPTGDPTTTSPAAGDLTTAPKDKYVWSDGQWRPSSNDRPDRSARATPSASPKPAASRLSAGTWLERLDTLLEKGDLLRARMALERLRRDHADDPQVREAQDKLDAISERVATGLRSATIRDEPTHVVRTSPPSSAEWQAAMQLAEQMVAAGKSPWIVVMCVQVEDDTVADEIRLSGSGVAFYGGESVTEQTACGHGGLVFVGSSEAGQDQPSLAIRATGHAQATIRLEPSPGSVRKFGDVVLRRAADGQATTRSSDGAESEEASAAPTDPASTPSSDGKPEAADPVALVDDFIRWFESQYTEHMLVVDGKDTDVKESIDDIGLDKTIDRYAAIRRVVLDYARQHADRKDLPEADLRRLATKQYELVVANVRGSGKWINYKADATRDGIIDSYAQGAKAWIPFYQRLLAAGRQGVFRDFRELIREALTQAEYQALMDANDRGSEIFYAALKKGVAWYAPWKPWVTSALDKSLAKDKAICQATVRMLYGPKGSQ